ncbi:hypothetical protein BZM27_04060 [Paraburkholderia steynii]|uniref:Uncharacterized protein n=1 Tax=Paraburkholderia steynii TaxID=1245441 RepID=A0A4R0XL63_9BURK|nr:hypothetical protein BZM27_04060 [Paraburkholderia steynii]
MMSLLGKAAVLIWNDVIETERDAFYRWHDKEHIPERLALPGFLRGRRYRGSGVTEWLTLYEAADVAVLTSPAYLARLNDPTPLTQSTVRAFRNTARSMRRREDDGRKYGRPCADVAAACRLRRASPVRRRSARHHGPHERAGRASVRRRRRGQPPRHARSARARIRSAAARAVRRTSTLEAARKQLTRLLAGIDTAQREEAAAGAGVFTLEISRLATLNH